MLELDLKISLHLRRLRKRELHDDGPCWHGIASIRQAAGLPKTKEGKAAARAALDRLIAAGHVKRAIEGNGHYMVVGPDYIMV